MFKLVQTKINILVVKILKPININNNINTKVNKFREFREIPHIIRFYMLFMLQQLQVCPSLTRILREWYLHQGT